MIVFEKLENKTVINYYDDGVGMDDKLVNNPQSIFQLGVRESIERGSGIGMFDVKKRIDGLKGDIKFLGNNIRLKGASFQVII